MPRICGIGGGKLTASATFTKSDDGKTLTITGKGDLTTLEITTYDTKFTSSAEGAVYVKSGDEYTSINSGDEFSENNSYYKVIPGEKTLIENTESEEFLNNSTYVKSSSTIQYLKSEYIGKVFTSDTPSSSAGEWIDNGTLVGESDIIDTGTKNYYIIDEANGKHNVMIGSIQYNANPIL